MAPHGRDRPGTARDVCASCSQTIPATDEGRALRGPSVTERKWPCAPAASASTAPTRSRCWCNLAALAMEIGRGRGIASPVRRPGRDARATPRSPTQLPGPVRRRLPAGVQPLAAAGQVAALDPPLDRPHVPRDRAIFALIGAFFVVLFTRRYPQGIFNFVVGVCRWAMRVTAYTLLLVDKYPPFSLERRPRLPGARRRRLSAGRRDLALAAALRLDPGDPAAHHRGAGALGRLLRGRRRRSSRSSSRSKIPRGLFDFVVNALRYNARANAYAYCLTEKYPGFAWG